MSAPSRELAYMLIHSGASGVVSRCNTVVNIATYVAVITTYVAVVGRDCRAATHVAVVSRCPGSVAAMRVVIVAIYLDRSRDLPGPVT